MGTEDKLLLALSPQDGRESFRLALPAPLVTQVVGFREWVLVPTRDSQGWLLALKPREGPPVFTLRLDTPLLTRPVVLGDQLFVLGQDGRVLSWTSVCWFHPRTHVPGFHSSHRWTHHALAWSIP